MNASREKEASAATDAESHHEFRRLGAAAAKRVVAVRAHQARRATDTPTPDIGAGFRHPALTAWRLRLRATLFGGREGSRGRVCWAPHTQSTTVGCFENRQRSAGTRRVRQTEHERERADTSDTRRNVALQHKRDRR